MRDGEIELATGKGGRIPRYKLDRSATIATGDRILAAELDNISEGGALFNMDARGPVQAVIVSIPGLAEGVRARVPAEAA